MSKLKCFRQYNHGKIRPGIWIVDEEDLSVGIFFHGDRDEIQESYFWCRDLENMVNNPSEAFFRIVEITKSEVLRFLENWPLGQKEAENLFRKNE